MLSSTEIDDVNSRLSALADAEGGDLYVVFVDEFTDPSDSVDWTDQTAIDNGLATDQYLVAIAVDAGQYAISADSDGPLSDDEVDRVVQAMENGLRASDWGGAVIAAADAFPGQGGGGDGISTLTWVLVAAVIIVAIILVVVLVSRSRKKKQQTSSVAVPDPNDPYASLSDEDLETQAGSALVQADDAITSSRQEVGFAVAQYGDDSTRTFTQVVEAAKAKVGEAFALKQKIDDEIPDTAPQRRAWHIQIIQLCDEADDLLNDNIEAFEELRLLEAQAPQALERVTARRAGGGSEDRSGSTGPGDADADVRCDGAGGRRRQPRSGAAASRARRRGTERGRHSDRRGPQRRGRIFDPHGGGSRRAGRAPRRRRHDSRYEPRGRRGSGAGHDHRPRGGHRRGRSHA